MFRFPRLIQLITFLTLALVSLHLQGQVTRSTASPQLVLKKARQLFDEGQYQTASILVEDYLSSNEAKGLLTENETEEFSTWQHQILDEQYLQLEGNNFFEDLLP